jgi:hypothetical protein
MLSRGGPRGTEKVPQSPGSHVGGPPSFRPGSPTCPKGPYRRKGQQRVGTPLQKSLPSDEGKPSYQGVGDAVVNAAKTQMKLLLECLVELLKNLAIGSTIACAAKMVPEIGHIITIYDDMEAELCRLKAAYYLVTKQKPEISDFSIPTSPASAVSSAIECSLTALLELNQEIASAAIGDSFSATGVDNTTNNLVGFVQSRAIEWVIHVYKHVSASVTDAHGGIGDDPEANQTFSEIHIDTLLDTGEVIVGDKHYQLTFLPIGEESSEQAGGKDPALTAWIVAGLVSTVVASLLQ